MEIKKKKFTDAELLERKKKDREEVLKKCEEVDKERKNLSPAEGIRQECKILKDFLDYVFGEGTSEKAFKGKNSLKECVKAYEDIFRERDRQVDSLNKIVDEYSPERLER